MSVFLLCSSFLLDEPSFLPLLFLFRVSHSFRAGLQVSYFLLSFILECFDFSFIREDYFPWELDSGFIVGFFQHLRNVPLASTISDEKYSVFQFVSPFSKIYLPLTTSRYFPLSLFFQTFDYVDSWC